MNRPLRPNRKPPLSKGTPQDDILNSTPFGFSERMNPLMTPFSPTPQAHAGQFAGFCKSYVPPRGGGPGGAGGLFDEMEEPDGTVRPHSMKNSSLLDDLGPAEHQRRWETARQLIHDNGVTYNVYGDPAGMDRPWNLDAIPHALRPRRMGPRRNRSHSAGPTPRHAPRRHLRPAAPPP